MFALAVLDVATVLEAAVGFLSSPRASSCTVQMQRDPGNRFTFFELALLSKGTKKGQICPASWVTAAVHLPQSYMGTLDTAVPWPVAACGGQCRE